MKVRSINYQNDDFALDNIDFREGSDPKVFKVGQKVRISLTQEMVIDGVKREVKVTDLAEVESVTKNKIAVRHHGKRMSLPIEEVRELNRQSRMEYSAWKTFREDPSYQKRSKDASGSRLIG